MELENQNQQAHFKYEKTLVLIKPDGIQRSLIGEIIKRYERIGLKLVAMKMVLPDESLIEKHYTIDPEWKRKAGEKKLKAASLAGEDISGLDPVQVAESILGFLKKYLTSCPVIAMVWQGAHAVQIIRKISGTTEPLSSDVGTIRGDLMLDSYNMSDSDGRAIRNLLHASTSVEEAEKEISLWFKPEEICSYRLIQEQIIYDVNLDGILE